MTLSLTWDLPPASANMDGISILVNDVERRRRFFSSENVAIDRVFNWTRLAPTAEGLGMAEYFRFAFIRDGVTVDYTKASTWFANGTWAV